MTTATLPEAARSGSAGLARLSKLVRRPALWRITSGVAGAALAAIMFFAAPGSIELVRHAPGGAGSSALPMWARPCLDDPYVSVEGPLLAFCARADGRVVGSVTKSDGETHLVLTGGFHLTLVQLPPGIQRPSWGSRVVAVGPLGSTDGLRELQAIRLVRR